MNLKDLTDGRLLDETKKLVGEERRLSLTVLWHLREIERRQLFAERGYSSLYSYCTRGLGYTEAAAYRRIQAARLLATCPEIAPRIESGALSLSVISQAQTFFKQEDVEDLEKKREILESLEHQSTREAEQSLAERAAEPVKLKREKAKPLSKEYTEIRFTADQALMRELNELKDLLGLPHLKDTIAWAVRQGLAQKRMKAPKVSLGSQAIRKAPVASQAVQHDPSPQSPVSTPAPEVGERQKEKVTSVRPDPRVKEEFVQAGPANAGLGKPISSVPSPCNPGARATRFIRIEVRRAVWARDQGRCTYVDPYTKRKCETRFGLELDHLKPHALGGENTAANLALKCRTHNLLAARTAFGVERMAKYQPSLRL